jgi:hypothetical protein
MKNENCKKDHSPVETEIEVQRLNKLDHYRGSFELSSGKKIDADYFDGFTTHVKTWTNHETNEIQELAIKLVEAGKQNNADAVRSNLPALCSKLREHITGKYAETIQINEVLSRLKESLLAGEVQKAETILNELNASSLTPSDRQLYLRLYEFLLTGETEKAIDVIEDFEKL